MHPLPYIIALILDKSTRLYTIDTRLPDIRKSVPLWLEVEQTFTVPQDTFTYHSNPKNSPNHSQAGKNDDSLERWLKPFLVHVTSDINAGVERIWGNEDLLIPG